VAAIVLIGASCAPGGGAAEMPVQVTGCEGGAQVVRGVEPSPSRSLRGDVDGDGAADSVFIVTDSGAQTGCRALLVFDTGNRRLAVGADTNESNPALGTPRLSALVRIDEHGGLGVVVEVATGASTSFAGVFGVLGERASAFRQTVAAVGAQNLFAYGGSVGHLSGVDCLEDGAVIASEATPAPGGDPGTYRVVRRVLALKDGSFRLVSRLTKSVRAPVASLDRWPELVSPPFASCPTR
jgi:hypothetical protein